MTNEIKRPVMKKVLANSAWGFLASLITRGGALVFAILLARFLLPEKYGLYGLALAIALFFMTFANLGVSQTLIRYLSYALGKNNKKQAAAYFKYILKIQFIVILSSSLSLLILAYPLSIYVFKKPQLILPLILFSLYILILSIEGFFNSIFTAVKKTQYLTLRETLSQIIRIGLIVLLFLGLSTDFYVNGTIIVLIITAFLMLIYSLYLSKKLLPFIFRKQETTAIDKKRVLKFLKASIILGLSGIFFSYIDSIMLGIFIPQTEFLGYYRAAYTLIFSIAGLLSFSSILMPFFVQFKKHNLNKALTNVLRYTAILSIPALVGIMVLGNYFIVTIYGHEYLLATIPLYFLAFLIFEESFAGTFGTLFVAREKPQYMIKIVISSSVLNIILNVVLIISLAKISPIWAVAGASIATLTSRYFFMFYTMLLARRKFNIKPSFRFLNKIIFASLIMAIALIAIQSIISDMNLYLGLMLILLGITIYTLTLLLTKGIEKEDIEIIKQFILGR